MSQRLKQEWIDIIVAKIAQSGEWKKFNPAHEQWLKLQSLTYTGLLRTDDLPPEPDPENFS